MKKIDLVLIENPIHTMKSSDTSYQGYEDQSKTKPSTEIPRWLDELFFKFSVIYGGLWTTGMKEKSFLLQKQIQWFGSVHIFDPKLILHCVDRCQELYDMPPSIKQFVELCRSERDRHNFYTEPLLEDKRCASISPLLAEYMRKNSVKEDDPFKKIFEKYKGKERGFETIKEIRRQLSNKMSLNENKAS